MLRSVRVGWVNVTKILFSLHGGAISRQSGATNSLFALHMPSLPVAVTITTGYLCIFACAFVRDIGIGIRDLVNNEDVVS